jgi:hypothetical protein
LFTRTFAKTEHFRVATALWWVVPQQQRDLWKSKQRKFFICALITVEKSLPAAVKCTDPSRHILNSCIYSIPGLSAFPGLCSG